MKNKVGDRYQAFFAQYYANIDAAERTLDRRVAAADCLRPVAMWYEFVQQRIRYASMVLNCLQPFTTSTVGFSFIIIQVLLLVAMFDFFCFY